MKTADFEYTVPEELIARRPPEHRGVARLLHIDRDSGTYNDRSYGDIVDILQPGDVLVVNQTRVIKARLFAEKKATGARRELVLVEQHGADDDWHRHRVMYRGRLASGDELCIGKDTIVVDQILGDGLAIVKSQRSLLDIAEEHGTVPLPPYMNRDADAADIDRYQTVFAQQAGSVAAPTASLNMTDDLLARLKKKGVIVTDAMLHVGLGTFMPIRVDDVTKHTMHQEYYEVPEHTIRHIQTAKAEGHKVVALGTTITRTLEYAHEAILHQSPQDISGEADIFIYPGYDFKVIDGLITNFHMPESTVLMLTAAFAGWDILRPAYMHAVEQRYQFFSYGDSTIII